MFIEAANREKEAGMDDNIYTEKISLTQNEKTVGPFTSKSS